MDSGSYAVGIYFDRFLQEFSTECEKNRNQQANLNKRLDTLSNGIQKIKQSVGQSVNNNDKALKSESKNDSKKPCLDNDVPDFSKTSDESSEEKFKKEIQKYLSCINKLRGSVISSQSEIKTLQKDREVLRKQLKESQKKLEVAKSQPRVGSDKKEEDEVTGLRQEIEGYKGQITKLQEFSVGLKVKLQKCMQISDEGRKVLEPTKEEQYKINDKCTPSGDGTSNNKLQTNEGSQKYQLVKYEKRPAPSNLPREAPVEKRNKVCQTNERSDLGGKLAKEKEELQNELTESKNALKEITQKLEVSKGKKNGGMEGRKDEITCKICNAFVVDCVIIECGHMNTCSSCAEKMEECPKCKQRNVKIVKIIED